MRLPFFDFFHNSRGVIRIMAETSTGVKELLKKNIDFNLEEKGYWKQDIYVRSIVRFKGDIIGDFMRENEEFKYKDLKILVEYEGFEFNVAAFSRPRNPDGTVNHTKLELV